MNEQRMTEGRFAGRLQLREDNLIKRLAYYPVETALQEGERVFEAEGRQFTCVGVYTFPFTRPGQKNANDRIYGVDLWQGVIARGEGVGSSGLMDHPSGDSAGSTKDVWCYWRNIRFNADKSLVLADAWLVGDWGREVKERLDAGGDIGLSSVGYGDFLRDGKTIDPASYELDRVADYVLNPSYAVYGTFEGEVKESSAPAPVGTLTESIEPVPALKKETTDQGVKPMNARQIREATLTIETLLDRNLTISDLKTRREDVNTILTYFDEDVVASGDATLLALQEKTKVLAEETDKQVEALYEKGLQLEAKLAEREALDEATLAQSFSLQAKVVDKDYEISELQERLDLALRLAEDTKKALGNLKEAYLHEKKKNSASVKKESYSEMKAYAEKARQALNDKIAENVELNGKLAEANIKLEDAQGKLNGLVEAFKTKTNRITEAKTAETNSLVEAEKAEWETYRANAVQTVREWVDANLANYPEMKKHERKLLSYRSLGEVQWNFGRMVRES